MDAAEARGRVLVASAPVARLATHGPNGRIDLVPVTFALLDDGRLATAVDHKPKTTTRLARLANVAADPAVGLLVDHWDHDDWTALWWVRLHGRAEVAEPGSPDHAITVAALADRYAQYRDQPPAGPALLVVPTAWRVWEARTAG